MDGWGARFITVAPSGLVLPCHAAASITSLAFENARERSLEWIWSESASFKAFRGDDWMKEPCRSCDRKAIDFGGCRCQAFALIGDAAATDPACSRSPRHAMIEEARAASAQGSEIRFLYRGRR
jgi:pyrroloquinoline quinone biosynthesis protein E